MPAERTRAEETERLIQDTEDALANVRLFLDQLDPSNEGAHEKIGMFADELERKIERLNARR